MLLHTIAEQISSFSDYPKIEITSYAIDSRLVEKGALFFAITGAKVDGHSFLKDIAEKGAVAAVVHRSYQGPSFGLQLIFVDDVKTALHTLARSLLKQKPRPQVIAVTGSVGKTTTKEFIYTLLNGSYRVAKSPGNANSQLSLPLVVLNAPQDIDILILEMGMNNPGHIANLVSIAPPDFAVVTKIGHAHIEFFSDGIEGIAKEKASIFSSYQTKLGFYNAADTGYKAMLESGIARKKTFSALDFPADFNLIETDKGHKFLYQGSESIEFEIPFEGKHLLDNLSAAIAVAKELGVEDFKIIERIKMMKNFERRFEIIEKGGVKFINDSYSAIPEAVKAALDNFPACSGRRISVLGEMRELGSFAPQAYEMVGHSAVNKVDCLFCLGKGTIPMIELFNKEGKQAHLFEDLNSLKEMLSKIVQPGDAVLIKGANSLQMWKILE